MIIRICIDENSVDWNVPQPELITFSDVLEAIYQASDDQLIVTAFEYVDEEKDFITVKNDDDLQSMIQFHLCCDLSNDFLTIFPKASRKPGKRNKHGLKLAISQPTARVTSVNDVRQHPSREPDMGSKSFPTEPAATMPSQSFSEDIEMDSLSNLAFEYLEMLGNGNGGVVYKVNHKKTNMVMAVKSIGIDLTGREQDRIRSELAILSKCNSSPQIIDFYGAFFDENRIFLCTEYMDGGSFDRYGKLPESVLKRVSHRVVSGLKFLWDNRIMHRDVKPSNMLVNSRGQVKLCDFGVSRQLVNSIAKTYIGTNAYMAPERVAGFDYTIYSDIWSLGLSICEMALGHFPYPDLALKLKSSRGIVPMEILQCIVNEAPPCLPDATFSPEIVDFVNGCLQKEASSRPSPEVLCEHAYLKIDDISNFEDPVIASWLVSTTNGVFSSSLPA